jgi:hypothetical protein
MSRYYSMRLCIEGFDANRSTEIKAAASYQWDFHDDHWEERTNSRNYLECESDGCLCGGETDDEFVDRLSLAVWKANRGFCIIEVTAIYLDAIPSEFHSRDQKDYARLMKEQNPRLTCVGRSAWKSLGFGAGEKAVQKENRRRGHRMPAKSTCPRAL